MKKLLVLLIACLALTVAACGDDDDDDGGGDGGRHDDRADRHGRGASARRRCGEAVTVDIPDIAFEPAT